MAKSGTVPFYNGVVETSVRLAGDSYLTLDNAGSATSTQKCTLSCWFKRTELTVLSNIFHSANDSGGASFGISLDAADSISVTQYSGASPFDAAAYDFGVTVAPIKFRDTSAWYHLVVTIDTTLGSGTTNEADRIKIYINGTRQTVVATSDGSGSQDFADEDQTVASFQDGKQRWGATVTGSQIAHIYLAECNGVDGLALDASYFGETKNGVWIPKAPNVSEYGNHGFRLQFTSTAHDAPASLGSADTDNIGADSSGKNNHFTAVDAIDTYDCAMPDSPENNFATWNPIYRQYGDNTFLALTNGALFVTGGGDVNSDRAYAMSTMSVNEILRNSDGAGAYMEVRSPSVGGDNGYIGLLGQSRADQRSDGALGRSDNSGYSHYHLISPNGRTLLEAGESSSAALAGLNGAPDDNAVIGFAVKSDGKFFISVDGTFSTNADGDTQNPATGANPMGTIDTTIDFFFHCGNISAFQGNFGQDGTFGGNETTTSDGETYNRATNTDANGIGSFHAPVPTGYLAMCTSNMAEPTIGPNSDTQATDYFNTVIYSGNNDATRTFDVGFVSDWSWFKARNGDGYGHQLYDSNRGVTKRLFANTTAAESTNAEGVTSFDSSGNLAIGTDAFLNEDGTTMVIWNWKCNGGTATATISESGNNPAAVVQANPTAGFSIITYTGTGAVGTIAHGLGAIPKLMLIKNRTSGTTDDWMVYHGENSAYTSAANQTISPQDEHLHLNNTLLSANVAENFNDTAPTSSVLTVGTTHNVNADGETYVAYVFAEVLGYSKFGSYIGIEESDGTFQYTGFRPAFLICKLTNGGTTAHWAIFDNKRETGNVNDNVFFIDGSVENSAVNDRSVDFLSNGFKVRSSAFRINGDADTVVYIAFAEVPFKYANAK